MKSILDQNFKYVITDDGEMIISMLRHKVYASAAVLLFLGIVMSFVLTGMIGGDTFSWWKLAIIGAVGWAAPGACFTFDKCLELYRQARHLHARVLKERTPVKGGRTTP